MDTEDVHSLVEKIYAAALDPSGWDTVLQLFRARFASTAVGLFIHNPLTHQAASAPTLGIEDEWLQAYEQRFAKVNPWFQPTCLMEPGRILTDLSVDQFHDEPGRFTRTEYYRCWMRPQGLRHKMGGALSAAGDGFIHFTYFRPACHGPYTPSEIRRHGCFAGHLRQAVEINGRLQDLDCRLRVADGLLDSIGHGVILLDQDQRAFPANSKAESQLNATNGLTLKHGRLRCQRRADNARLQRVIQAASSVDPRRPAMPSRLALKRRSGRACLSVAVTPIARRCCLSVDEPATALVVTDMDAPPPEIDEDYLQTTYGLASKEARLAQRLVTGQVLKSAASDLGLSYETARWYLKSILKKTGTHRQSELLRCILCDLATQAGAIHQPPSRPRLTL